MLAPTLRKVATGGDWPIDGSAGAPNRPVGGTRLSQTPEKSGLPLGSRGAGAFRSTCPSAVRGTSGRTNVGHWAVSATGTVHASTRANAILISDCTWCRRYFGRMN
jgi:hypothetical protein